ncbi:PIN domain-like protein, partial [Lentinus tigrinus ALCF2SS1-7]|uniref:PIN domain-like protein n=1 Tax=Lentinus tigrinus ALCF2SS1-7 TaxID=1328758 RepID=UPI0011660C0B
AHAQAGQNPELRTLFFRLAHLFAKPVAVVFVEDGPDRPDMKRGVHVRKKQHWLTKGMRALVEGFGFEWIQAPGEAEAELAAMNQAGLIDTVMSDDGDTLVFGADVVIRKYVLVYRASAMQEHAQVRMTRNSLILLAVLAGGDYDSGLKGCGVQTACGLARYSLGDSLVESVTAADDSSSLRTSLSAWRDDLRRYLRDDPEKHVGRCNASLADNVSDTFPALDVVLAYIRPLTTSPDNIALDYEFGRASKFNLAQLRDLCDRYFDWDKETLWKRFHKHVWPGVVLR